MWQQYQLILRVLAPTHIGWNKIGNVQRTRPYVTGRALWGALTARLTRDQHATPTEADYRATGRWVHEHLALPYLYPAVQHNGTYRLLLPWDDTTPARILSSYTSTALEPSRYAADEGLLHEVEYIAPYTCDTGEPVYLVGLLFLAATGQEQLASLCHALQRLQIGGERGYGWGRLRLVDLSLCAPCTSWDLFCTTYAPELSHPRPRLTLTPASPLLAHTIARVGPAQGELEPLVGREWAAAGAGQHLAYNGVCYAPGALLTETANIEIGSYGIWHPIV
ncbi:MAG: hypothetical protein HC911_13020 [Chloroflexaceae bacterium]|nr:hypothetical protein [Chloroflexaceae bacterium]